jgi:hypothetical protein
MSFLSTPKKNAAYERGAKGYVEMESKVGGGCQRECSQNVGKFVSVGWEKSK